MRTFDRGRVKTRNGSDYALQCSNSVRIGGLKIRVERSAGSYVAQSGSLPEFSHALDPKRPFARIGESGATTMPMSIRIGRRKHLVVS